MAGYQPLNKHTKGNNANIIPYVVCMNTATRSRNEDTCPSRSRRERAEKARRKQAQQDGSNVGWQYP